MLRFKKFLLIIKRKHYFCLIVHLTARSKSFKIACVIGSMVLNKQHFQNHIMVLKVCISLEIKIVNFDMTISVLYEYYIFCGMTYHYSSTCWHQKPICHFFQVCSRMSGIRRSNTLILSMQLLFMMNIYTKRKSIYNKNIQKGDLYPFHFPPYLLLIHYVLWPPWYCKHFTL